MNRSLLAHRSWYSTDMCIIVRRTSGSHREIRNKTSAQHLRCPRQWDLLAMLTSDNQPPASAENSLTYASRENRPKQSRSYSIFSCPDWHIFALSAVFPSVYKFCDWFQSVEFWYSSCDYLLSFVLFCFFTKTGDSGVGALL